MGRKNIGKAPDASSNRRTGDTLMNGEDFDTYEDVEPSRPTGPLSRLPAPKDAIPALLCFFLFIVCSMLHWNFSLGTEFGASGESIFTEGEYWRLLTSLFIHADIIHVLSNAFLFLIFGWLLKAYFGTLVFPASSFIIGMLTTAITIATYEPHIRLIGASGMIYGMAALWLLFYIGFDYDHPLQVRIFRAVGFVMVMLLPTTLHPSISYRSHAVGFAVGIVGGILLLPTVRQRIKSVMDKEDSSHYDPPFHQKHK